MEGSEQRDGSLLSSLREEASAVGGADGKISLLDAQHLVEQLSGGGA